MAITGYINPGPGNRRKFYTILQLRTDVALAVLSDDDAEMGYVEDEVI